jgi:ATP/maltotriose-dependent transcriptional regulator MalT
MEDALLFWDADTAAYFGRLGKARELSNRAVASAKRAEEKETASFYEGEAALREALFGDPSEARQRATTALALSKGRDPEFVSALALAFSGDVGQAQMLTDDLAKRFQEDTIVQSNYLPALQAQLVLDRKNPSRAIDFLQAAAPYELLLVANLNISLTLYPVYVRGEAYLAWHQGGEAATEFQKILSHRGSVLNEPIVPLAHLGLARAYALQGDTAKARVAYRDFLTLWKAADPDVPILKEAKAEYAKLQ